MEDAIDPVGKEVRDRLFRTAIIILKSFPSPSCREMEVLNCFDVFGGLLCPLLRHHLHFVILASFLSGFLSIVCVRLILKVYRAWLILNF